MILPGYFKIIFQGFLPAHSRKWPAINFLCGLKWVRGSRWHGSFFLKNFTTNLSIYPVLIINLSGLKWLHPFEEEFYWKQRIKSSYTFWISSHTLKWIGSGVLHLVPFYMWEQLTSGTWTQDEGHAQQHCLFPSFDFFSLFLNALSGFTLYLKWKEHWGMHTFLSLVSQWKHHPCWRTQRWEDDPLQTPCFLDLFRDSTILMQEIKPSQ